MSRGQRLVAMVLASKKDSSKQEVPSSTAQLPCSSQQAIAMDLEIGLGWGNNLEAVNSNIINNELDISVNPIEDGVIYDDSDVDPNYVPSVDDDNRSETSNESTASLAVAARQIEENLSEPRPNKNYRRIITSKRNLGEEYYTQKGKLVLARSVKQLDPNCKKKCSKKITSSDQQSIFEEYWKLGSYNLRQAFLSGMIAILPKKTETKIKSLHAQRNRVYSYNYFVEVQTVRFQVCQKCFLCVFGETPQFIKTIIKKKINCGGVVISSDKRGRMVPPNKVSEEKYNEVLEHISSFPHYESHYTRRHTGKKYLQSDLNMSIMYKLYTAKYDNHVSITKYAEIFKSQNLKFKKPQLDVCNKCELLEMQLKSAENEDDKLKLKMEKAKHLEQADSAYENKKEDQQNAKTCQTIKTYTFDLQQCLPTPLFRTSISFYKRQLWTFNLTIHDAEQNSAYNMMWHEAEGNRGGNEIASCLFDHLLNVPSQVSHIVLYSDSCPGQNKNSFLTAMFQVLIQILPHLQYIDHKFMVPGHTHMECDTVHSLIERKKKKTTATIHHPRDWFNFVRSVKANYYVTEITRDKFYNFSDLIKEKFMWRKNNSEGERFLWQQVRWLRYTRKLGQIEYKTTLNRDTNFKILNIHRRGINSISREDLKLCYESSIKISEKKKQDLLQMLPLISQEFHSFYTNLVTDALPDEDPDLLGESDYKD